MAKNKTAPVPKVPAKKVEKKVKTPKVPKASKSKVKLISFTVGAVIPTQSYGNIQPSITIEAGSIEEARGIVMPVIEDLIRTYAETKPGFLGRVEVKETVVTPPAPAAKATESSSSAQAPVAAPASPAPAKPVESTSPKHPAVEKAEKALGLAATQDAVNMIQKQIEKSEKIPQEFKNALVEKCYARFNALKK